MDVLAGVKPPSDSKPATGEGFMEPICEKHKTPKTWMKDKHNKSGGRWRCRTCQNGRSVKHREENQEYLTEQSRLRRAEYREVNREEVLAYNREYCKQYRERNKAKIKEARDLRREENPDKRKEEKAARRAAERGSLCPSCKGAGYADAASGECYVCEVSRANQTDHVFPLAHGGRHCKSNFKGICGDCNASKGARVWPGGAGWDEFVSERRVRC